MLESVFLSNIFLLDNIFKVAVRLEKETYYTP